MNAKMAETTFVILHVMVFLTTPENVRVLGEIKIKKPERFKVYITSAPKGARKCNFPPF